MKKVAIAGLCLWFLFGAAAWADEQAAWKFSVGLKLQAAKWEGENKSDHEDFDATTTQPRFDFRAAKRKFYSSLSFQGGEYDFDNSAPQKVYKNSHESTRDVTVERGEFDLIAGYYFWRYVSLFIDLKAFENKWRHQNYSMEHGGAGLGVAGYFPLSATWTLFGSIGFSALNVETDGDDIGDAKGSALELGAMYVFTEHVNFTLSLKAQHYEYDFDEDSEQDHDIGDLVFGVNYVF